MSKKVTPGSSLEPRTYDEGTDRAGYCSPPLHTRWQKGQSGNPRGRPKYSLNLKTIADMLDEELAELVSVQGPNGKHKVSKQRAFFKKMINDSLMGNARDKKILLEAMFRLAERHSPEDGAASEMVAGGDDALERYVQRVRRRENMDDTAPDGEEP